MAIADTTYVQERDDVLYIGDTRVTVHSLIAAWQNEGYTAEELWIGFPALSLAQVYGAIAYYLDHQSALDPLFAAENERYAARHTEARANDPEFYRQLEERKDHMRQRLASRNVPEASTDVGV
ncbi:MAG: DUF433 domain-containing protein [Ktedonobacterales bacterium]